MRERVVVTVWLTREAGLAGDPFNFAHGMFIERPEKPLRSATGVYKAKLDRNEARPGRTRRRLGLARLSP